MRDWADDEPAFDDWDAWSTDQTEKPRTTHPAIQVEPERVRSAEIDGFRTGQSDDKPSPKQIDYLVSLIGQEATDAVRFTKAAYSAAIDEAAPDPTARKANRYGGDCGRCGQRVDAEAGLLTGSAGSWGVEHDGACPEVEAEPEPAEAREPEPDLQGIHRTDDDVIYKVQLAIHGSGHPYAKRLDTDAEGGPSFEYAPGALRELSVDTLLSIEEAKEWGILYGVCCVCGRTLTEESSIAAGIGPVCAAKF